LSGVFLAAALSASLLLAHFLDAATLLIFARVVLVFVVILVERLVLQLSVLDDSLGAFKLALKRASCFRGSTSAKASRALRQLLLHDALVGHYLLETSVEFIVSEGHIFRRRSVTGAWSRHPVLAFVRVGRDAHSFLVRGVESILDESNILLLHLFNLLEPFSLRIDLSLKLLNQLGQFLDLVFFSADQHLQFLPLDVDIGALLFGLLFHTTARLKHFGQLFEVMSCQLLRSVGVEASLGFGFLDFSDLLRGIVVISNDLGGALAPVVRVKVLNVVIGVFLDRLDKL